jgi:hypothetical protein
MTNLKTFLENNKKEVVDFIESNQRPIALEDNIYNRLLQELIKQIPITKHGSVALDKAHVELAIAILEAMWCGWLSQAKANREAYTKDYPDRFKGAIYDAFGIGQQYAEERP